ncbi:MAG: hypothetical protein KDD89_15665, partial [Anaerolineales bacterium]|nr:hypothetical protein [Anaerolineales bacterium]
MEPELPPPLTDPFIILGEQLDIFLIYFDRPLVRVQFFALLFIILLAFGLEIMASRRIDQKLDEWANSPNISDYRRPFFRLLNAMRYGSFSLGGVILLLSTIFLFEQFGQPTTILRQVIPLFFFVLAYQMLIAAIYLRFTRPLIEPLHRYVFSPLAFLLFFFLVTGNFVNLAR